MKKAGIIGCGWLGSQIVERLPENFELHITATFQIKQNNGYPKDPYPYIINLPDYLLIEKHKYWKKISSPKLISELDFLFKYPIPDISMH